MASKSSKKRRRAQKQAAQAQVAVRAACPGKIAPQFPSEREPDAARPTSQRMARGNWRLPSGMGKHEQPVIDTSVDIVGQLLDAGRITSGQEQAARHWQALRAAYVSELPDVSGFRSCIAGSVPGFDDGDGDAQVIQAYREIERRLSRPQRVEMLHVCEDGYRPRDLNILRSALDIVGR